MRGNHPGFLSYLWRGRCLERAAGRLHLLECLQAGRFADRGAQVEQDADLGKVVLASVEGAGPHAVVGGDAADVDVVDASLCQDVKQAVATLGVQTAPIAPPKVTRVV